MIKNLLIEIIIKRKREKKLIEINYLKKSYRLKVSVRGNSKNKNKKKH